MDREKINKAAQLHDDLKKVKRAIALMNDANSGSVNIRISGTVGDEAEFAYLPKSMLPDIYGVLVKTEAVVENKMETL